MGKLWGMDSAMFGVASALVLVFGILIPWFYLGAVMGWNVIPVSLAGAGIGWGGCVGAAKLFLRYRVQ